MKECAAEKRDGYMEWRGCLLLRGSFVLGTDLVIYICVIVFHCYKARNVVIFVTGIEHDGD